jgi:hypothetical protein
MTREDANLNLEKLEDHRGRGTHFRIGNDDRIEVGTDFAEFEYLKDVVFVLDIYFKSQVK